MGARIISVLLVVRVLVRPKRGRVWSGLGRSSVPIAVSDSITTTTKVTLKARTMTVPQRMVEVYLPRLDLGVSRLYLV